jgi:hypothetical protein
VELRYKWDLTGLPREWISDAGFQPTCINPGNDIPIVMKIFIKKIND